MKNIKNYFGAGLIVLGSLDFFGKSFGINNYSLVSTLSFKSRY